MNLLNSKRGNMSTKYIFPLCIQLVPPKDIFGDKAFTDTLKLLQDNNFYGVELNITDFDGIDPVQLKEYLKSFDLKMTYIASGVYAKENELSLSSANENIRRKTVEEIGKMISFAEKIGCGIICGFIKGGVGENPVKAARQMQKSVTELKERYGDLPVKILLEATNHYEAAVLNTVAETVTIFADNSQNIQVLPDTYHMNIEEYSMSAALVQYTKYFDNIHISDNNRYFPGFGAIDFYQIFSLLKGMGYHGTMAIEGRNKNSLWEDIRISAAYLTEVCSRLI